LSSTDLPPDPNEDGAEDRPVPRPPETPASPPDPEPPAASRPGLSTFTIEGRSAPALFVVGWLASLLGFAAIAVALLSGNGTPGRLLLVVGMVVLAIGLIAGAGSQAVERRTRGALPYVGPSPWLVFAAVIPVAILADAVVAIPLEIVGVPLDGPFAAVVSVSLLAAVYLALVRLLVVDTGALDWRAMGVRALDRLAFLEMGGGALWAIPVIAVTSILGAFLQQIFRVSPPNPLPPTNDALGFGLSLLAGAIIAPFGEEIMFRAFATTAWVRGMGVVGGVIRGAFLFAFAHILTVAGSTADQAVPLAVVAFLAHVPVAIALGWIFVRRGTVWASFGLHATYNLIILVIVQAAASST
jgi:membrane protease YdiL (CAAX protease family)